MEISNQQVLDASAALERLGGLSLETELMWRFALNQNHLRPARDAIEKTRLSLIRKFQVGEEAPEGDAEIEIEGEKLTLPRMARLARFQLEWNAVRDLEVTWESPAKIGSAKFQVKTGKDGKAPDGWKANDIAPLLAIGIVIPPEVTE